MTASHVLVGSSPCCSRSRKRARRVDLPVTTSHNFRAAFGTASIEYLAEAEWD